jgi:hypothetical protein
VRQEQAGFMRFARARPLIGRQLASPPTKRVAPNGIPWILSNSTSHGKRAADSVRPGTRASAV